jgi:hypothetical protein
VQGWQRYLVLFSRPHYSSSGEEQFVTIATAFATLFHFDLIIKRFRQRRNSSSSTIDIYTKRKPAKVKANVCNCI